MLFVNIFLKPLTSCFMGLPHILVSLEDDFPALLRTIRAQLKDISSIERLPGKREAYVRP